jgi:hypothetical protein
MAWYRKTFILPESDKGKIISIEFDGVYMNSEVWINGEYLGKRPNGYISFNYDMTPYLKFGNEKNIIALKLIIQNNPIHAGILDPEFTGMYGLLKRIRSMLITGGHLLLLLLLVKTLQ